MTQPNFSNEELLEYVSRLIRKYSKLDDDHEISLQSKVRELGIDSIDLMEIVFELEEEYGIEMDDSVAMSAETLADIMEALSFQNFMHFSQSTQGDL